MQITLDQVTKRFGTLLALDEVSLEIPPGKIVAILGVNGAGKSTLVRMLGALLVPTEGEVRYDGEKFDRSRIDLRKRLALLPDQPPVTSGQTPISYMAMCLRLWEAHRPGIEELALSLLTDFDLLPLAESTFSILSRGQTYKAALAALIAADPELWLLDEPFAAGMDPRGIAALKRHASKRAGRGGTILYTTQIVEIAEQFSDVVCVLNRGRVVALEETSQLKRPHDAPGRSLDRLISELSEAGV